MVRGGSFLDGDRRRQFPKSIEKLLRQPWRAGDRFIVGDAGACTRSAKSVGSCDEERWGAAAGSRYGGPETAAPTTYDTDID